VTLVVLAGWTLFAFAGFYPWTTIPLMAGALALAALERPKLVTAGTRVLDLALLAALGGMALQLVPLPAETRASLAPAATAFDRALRVNAGVVPPRPISLDPNATGHALLVSAACLLAFFTTRSVLQRSGVRTVARGVAGLGLVLAPLTIVQHATSPRLLYWTWVPYVGNARPYGPFMNRNDLATWLVLAVPLTIGYLFARFESRRSARAGSLVAVMADSTAAWLLGAAGLMSAALIATLSRSGLAGAATAACVLAACAAWRTSWKVGVVWLLVAGAGALVAAAAFANIGDLAARLDAAVSEGAAGRLSIWRQTWPMARAFWPTGTGVGAYQYGMIPYQTSTRLFYLNHAHSGYLQLLSEGGALLVIPAAVAIGAAITQVYRRTMADRTPIFWIRAGAASGLIGFLTQSIWETTLRMPANGVLLALVAALALHPTDAAHKADAPRQ
jgi:O-antigen ligase